MTYTDAKYGFYLLYDRYGEMPDDTCGVVCNTWKWLDLLKTPTKTEAKKCYKALIDQYFDSGFEDPRNYAPLKNSIETMDRDIYDVFVMNGNIKK